GGGRARRDPADRGVGRGRLRPAHPAPDRTARRGSRRGRCGAMRGFWPVFRKEAVQMIRDKGSLRFALLTPAFQLVLFGLIDMNVRHVPTVVFDQSRTAQSRELINDFVNTSYFDVVAAAPSHEALREYIVAGRAAVGVEIPPDYARRRLNDQPADFLVLIDGSDSTISSQALAAANGAVLSRSVSELADRAGTK